LLPLTAAERAELTRLPRENAELKVEREILEKRWPSSCGVDEVTQLAFADRERARSARSPRCAGC
jgi:hypothetical protein